MTSKDKQLLLFFKHPLLKVAAAIKIQNGYRHYRWRKFENEFKLIDRLIEHRASLCVQSRWKQMKMVRRFRFLSVLKVYLEKIDSPTLYLEEQIYLQLENIIARISDRSTKFVDQYLRFYFDMKAKNIIMQNYRNPRLELSLVPNWVFDNRQEFLQHHSSQSKTSAQMFKSFTGAISPDNPNKQQLEPSMTMSSFSPRSKAENPTTVPMEIKMKSSIDVYENDIMALVHFTDGGSPSVIKDYNQIATSTAKSIDLKKGLKFIEMSFSSVLEAKRRALCVALLTFLLKHQTFIRLFTQRDIESGFFLPRVRELWESYGFQFTAKDLLLSNKSSDATY